MNRITHLPRYQADRCRRFAQTFNHMRAYFESPGRWQPETFWHDERDALDGPIAACPLAYWTTVGPGMAYGWAIANATPVWDRYFGLTAAREFFGIHDAICVVLFGGRPESPFSLWERQCLLFDYLLDPYNTPPQELIHRKLSDRRDAQ